MNRLKCGHCVRFCRSTRTISAANARCGWCTIPPAPPRWWAAAPTRGREKYRWHPTKPCRCTPDAVKRYRDKISGPLLDRIDLTIEVPVLPAADLTCSQAGESSAAVRQRVICARDIQYQRQGKTNAKLLPSELDTLAQIDDEAKQALAQMLEKLSLSARSFHRILRVSRTLADLAGDTVVTRGHVLQAIGFRRAI